MWFPAIAARRPGLRSCLVLGVLCGSAAGCAEREASPKPAAAAPEPASGPILRVAEQSWPQVVATQGDLVADETAVVGAKVAGRIDSVPVDLGDFVKAGTVLASLDRREYEERLRQAEAELTQARAAIGLEADDALDQLNPNAAPGVVEQKALWDQARADLDRTRGLRARQAVTDTQYELAVAAEHVANARHNSALNTAREKIALVRVRAAQVAVARQEFEDGEVRASFDGRVQDRHVSPGMYVQIGNAVVTLIRDDPLRYRGTVPEPYASSLAVGQRARLRLGTGPELPEVTISRISPALDPLSRSLLFEARVPNEDHAIQAGQFCQGEVILDRTRRVIALPQTAVVEFAGTQKVWKVVDGKAVEQPVETGIRREDLVEVLGGLQPGDEVLIDGAKGRGAKPNSEGMAAAKPADAPAGRTSASR